MTQQHMQQVLEDVRANQARLEACPLHDFQSIYPGQFGTKYICKHCHGTVDGLTARWYAKGREHERAHIATDTDREWTNR